MVLIRMYQKRGPVVGLAVCVLHVERTMCKWARGGTLRGANGGLLIVGEVLIRP